MEKVFFTIIATLCFGIIFNVKGRKIILTSLGGGVSYSIYLACLNYGLSIPFSCFLSSIVLTLYSEVSARRVKTPVTTILIPGLIPLVPGGGLYHTMYDIIIEKPVEAFTSGLETFLISCSLAMGIVFVTSFIKITKKNH